MRVVIELFREADGRLEGTVHLPGGRRDSFASTLDLLRALQDLDLARPPGGPGSTSDSSDPPHSEPEERHG
ncbi:MAG: hypothetical protein ACJ72G_00995 [Friedmanniella sp.]